jgi:hypothetical protein
MSERVEDLFDRYVDRLISGEESDVCLEDEAELGAMLAPLMQTGDLVVHQLRMVEPDPHFRAVAWLRMRNLFFARLARKDSRPGFLSLWWQQRWATALATAMVVCMAGLGVLAASFNALPSGFFYPVKVTTEQVRLSLTTSEYERAQLRLEYAERRLAEMTSMADRGDAETAVILASEATRIIFQLAGSGTFGPVVSDSGDVTMSPGTSAALRAPVAVLTADRAEALSMLQALLEVAPDELKPDIERFMGQLAREFDAAIAHLDDTTAP